MSTTETNTWPDLAIGLYDRLTGRNAEITYEMDRLQVQVPSSTRENASRATWEVSGVLKVRTTDKA